MVGAVSVMGSQLIEQKTRPSGYLISSARKKAPPLGPMELRSSFLDSYSLKPLLASKNFGKHIKKKKKNKSFVIVDELPGNYEDNFEDVKRQMVDYFTYKAVRMVLHQLYEMNPVQYRWFYDENGYGKGFIRDLGKEKQELAERVMVTRLRLYGKWVKECDHTEMYERISEQNLELMRERLLETVVWPPPDNSNMDEL
ncbi:Chaperonin-like RbcX protein [Striga hermonthica]|uniref:Chaperonin-like RbcX protein n=1 Tax=Striga hermonthica TaxID=68872 RepID=A0A9N7R3F0_STRHE|nr:Chaperonin-like RbcX protein [Striga hermonthica]